MADEVGESLKLNIKITSTGEDKLQTIAKGVATLEKSLGSVQRSLSRSAQRYRLLTRADLITQKKQ